MSAVDTEKKLIGEEKRLLRLAYVLFCAIFLLICAQLFLAFTVRQEVKTVELGYGREAAFISSAYERTDKMIEYFLSDYISDVRSLPDDVDQLFAGWQKAQKLTLKDGLLEKYYDDWQVSQRFDNQFIVFIEIEKIIKGIGDSYECHWKESVWRDRGIAAVEYWYGSFDLKMTDVTDVSEEEFLLNPTGIWVENFSIANKEL